MGWVRQQSGLSTTRKRFPLKGTCLAIYSRAVNSQTTLRDQLAQHYPWCAQWEIELGQLFGAYVAEKQRQQVLDYDDLLLYWCHMVSQPTLARHVGARFDHVLVDEYQDTNRLQAAILHAVDNGVETGPGPRLLGIVLSLVGLFLLRAPAGK
jgi:DNA helicase-2/ATP-dependent DNA helicase PcrA